MENPSRSAVYLLKRATSISATAAQLQQQPTLIMKPKRSYFKWAVDEQGLLTLLAAVFSENPVFLSPSCLAFSFSHLLMERRASYLLSEHVTLFLAGIELFLPALHVSRGLLQRIYQPGITFSQSLQLCFPLLGISAAVGQNRCESSFQTSPQKYSQC